MNAQRGEVVLVDFPFSDASGVKVRPAIVVQGDRRNAALTHTIVALVTRNLRHADDDPTQLPIDVATPDGKLTGLQEDSAVTFGNLYTVHERHLRKVIGRLSPELMRKGEACLRAALGLM
jgi:mRNA interferase MazF